MANLYQLHSKLLHDNKITDDEVAIVRNYIEQDGQLDLNDVKFLVELLSSARKSARRLTICSFPSSKR